MLELTCVKTVAKGWEPLFKYSSRNDHGVTMLRIVRTISFSVNYMKRERRKKKERNEKKKEGKDRNSHPREVFRGSVPGERFRFMVFLILCSSD